MKTGGRFQAGSSLRCPAVRRPRSVRERRHARVAVEATRVEPREDGCSNVKETPGYDHLHNMQKYFFVGRRASSSALLCITRCLISVTLHNSFQYIIIPQGRQKKNFCITRRKGGGAGGRVLFSYLVAFPAQLLPQQRRPPVAHPISLKCSLSLFLLR